jgi:pimeloyl-ACP methyl ester carboxylesterase
VFGHKPFAVLADHLTRAGLAVLRVDDRGVGQTTVSPQGSTIQKHVQDAASGLAFLRNRPEIDAARVGLIGHSEGALIAASLASQSKDVAFVVMLAGQGISGAEINPLQVEASLRAQGSVSEASVKAIVSMQRELMKMLARGAGESELMTQLKALQSESLSLVPKAARAQLTAEILNAQLQTQLKAISSPWFRSFVSTEPGPILAKVSCPILALIGSKDIQVPAGPNLAAIRAALAKGANTQSVLRELAGLNHLFQEAKTGAVSEYQSIAETFNTLALSAISNWLRQTTKLN